MQTGDKVIAKYIDPLPGNTIAPPLKMNESYEVKETHICGCGNQHIDVGLVSTVTYVSCYECKQELPDGDKKHWCHPVRFKKIS